MGINPERMRKAEVFAQSRSPCIRRKYGAVIDDGDSMASGANVRLSQCCSGDICIRDRVRAAPGSQVEKGAEIHAEQAVLIEWGKKMRGDTHFYLAGFDIKGRKLKGKNVWPCHTCALMIKYAGFDNIIITDTDGEVKPVSINYIIEEREKEWTILTE